MPEFVGRPPGSSPDDGSPASPRAMKVHAPGYESAAAQSRESERRRSHSLETLSVFGDDPSRSGEPAKSAPAEGVVGFGSDSSSKIDQTSSFLLHENYNVFAQDMQDRYRMDPRKKTILIMVAVLVVLMPLVMVLPYGFGQVNARLTPAALNSALQRNMRNLFNLVFNPGAAGAQAGIVIRYVMVAFAGAGLGVIGAVYQGWLRNPLASPSTLGVSAGASVGGVFFLVQAGRSRWLGQLGTSSSFSEQIAQMGFGDYLWYSYGKVVCMFVGALLVVLIVLLVAKIAGRGQTSSIWIVIAGSLVASALGSIVGLVRLYYTEAGDNDMAEALGEVLVLSFTSTARWVDLLGVGIPVAAGIVILLAFRSKIGLLAFGAEEARAMGVNASRMSALLVGTTTVMLAFITAFCGSIGFVGFLVPHITRRFIGPDFRYLVPASALSGAIILLVAYYGMTLVNADFGMYLGVLTSVIGVVTFIVMALTRKGGGQNDWI